MSSVNQLGSKCDWRRNGGERVVPGVECVGLPTVISYKL